LTRKCNTPCPSWHLRCKDSQVDEGGLTAAASGAQKNKNEKTIIFFGAKKQNQKKKRQQKDEMFPLAVTIIK